MVGAYSTFVNKGVWIEPIFITRIEDKNGVVLEEFTPKTNEAMSKETADLMVRMLQGVVKGVYSPAANKTLGTGVRLRHTYGFDNEINKFNKESVQFSSRPKWSIIAKSDPSPQKITNRVLVRGLDAKRKGIEIVFP